MKKIPLKITCLFMCALDKRINYRLILPDKIRAESSSSLLSSWLNDGIVVLDMEARNAISRIDRVLAAIV